MDWLLAGLIGAAMFLVGDWIGYLGGRADEREHQAVVRRIVDLTK